MLSDFCFIHEAIDTAQLLPGGTPKTHAFPSTDEAIISIAWKCLTGLSSPREILRCFLSLSVIPCYRAQSLATNGLLAQITNQYEE